MRKIVVAEFISLDGVVEAPYTWHFPYMSEDMGADLLAAIMATDINLFGRATYEEFAGYWPTAEDDGSGMGNKLNSNPKYVVSNTLAKADWQNTTIIKGDVFGEIARLKAAGDGEIGITGSPTLVQSLLPTGLIDEFRLMVHPVVVGQGKRLFAEGCQATLKLVNTKTYQSGVVTMTYQPAEK